MTRSQKQPILYQERLKIPEKFLRFATPAVVAVYRAEKLKCDRLVEIGAGIGGQTFAFSKTCKKILAIESDKESAKILIQNLKKLQINNVEVLIADVLSKFSIDKVTKFQPDIIFCDTERPEKAERIIANIKPSLKEILGIFPKISQKIAIEIPPFTQDIEKIKTGYDFEEEFISLNHQLNRLTLYFNTLKESEVSAVALPSKERVNFSSKTIKKSNPIKKYKYLYVIDPTIIIANLLSELSRNFDSPIIKLNKPVLLSNKKIKSNFLEGYEIISICKNNEKEILDELKKIDAGKIVLRYNINPKDYWKVRNFYENQIQGSKEISLFINESENEAILCEKL